MRKNTEEQKQIKKVEQDQDIEFGKLFVFIKDKKIITWDEINDVVGIEFASVQMDKIISMMEKNKVQIQEIEPEFVDEEDDVVVEDADDDEELESDVEAEIVEQTEKEVLSKKRLVSTEKDSGSDDPIRLYFVLSID